VETKTLGSIPVKLFAHNTFRGFDLYNFCPGTTGLQNQFTRAKDLFLKNRSIRFQRVRSCPGPYTRQEE